MNIERSMSNDCIFDVHLIRVMCGSKANIKMYDLCRSP